MLENYRQIKQEATNELLRLTLAIAIIAATIGVFTIDNEKYTFAVILQGFTLLPSLTLGLYMIFTAAHLKYKNAGKIGDLSVPEKLRRLCYDLSISLFWYMFLIFFLIFIAGLLGWDGNTKTFLDFWPSFIISFFVLGLLVVSSIFVKEKENNSKRKKKYKIALLWRKK